VADTKISGLTASSAPAGTDEFAVSDGTATSKKMTLAQVQTFVTTSPVFAAGSATAGSWPKLTSGTLQTTPDAGSLEMDANCLYGTTDAGNRGVIPVRHIIRADATRTFTSAVTSQVIFTSPANGRITLETGTYRIQGFLALTSMSATSGNMLINLLGAGTATVGAWLWQVWGNDANPGGAGAAVGGSYSASSSTTGSCVTAATAASVGVRLDGTFEVTAAGTLIPSLSLLTAAAAVLSIGSYLMLERLGSTSLVSIGQWD
jgi:hypothetical protein